MQQCLQRPVGWTKAALVKSQPSSKLGPPCQRRSHRAPSCMPRLRRMLEVHSWRPPWRLGWCDRLSDCSLDRFPTWSKLLWLQNSTIPEGALASQSHEVWLDMETFSCHRTPYLNIQVASCRSWCPQESRHTLLRVFCDPWIACTFCAACHSQSLWQSEEFQGLGFDPWRLSKGLWQIHKIVHLNWTDSQFWS